MQFRIAAIQAKSICLPVSQSGILIAGQKESDLARVWAALGRILQPQEQGTPDDGVVSLNLEMSKDFPGLQELLTLCNLDKDLSTIEVVAAFQHGSAKPELRRLSLFGNVVYDPQEKICVGPTESEAPSVFGGFADRILSGLLWVAPNTQPKQLAVKLQLERHKDWLAGDPAGKKLLKDLEKDLSAVFDQPLTLTMSAKPEQVMEVSQGAQKSAVTETEPSLANAILLLLKVRQAQLSGPQAVICLHQYEDSLPKPLLSRFVDAAVGGRAQLLATTMNPSVLKSFYSNHVTVAK